MAAKTCKNATIAYAISPPPLREQITNLYELNFHEILHLEISANFVNKFLFWLKSNKVMNTLRETTLPVKISSQYNTAETHFVPSHKHILLQHLYPR